MNPIECVYGLVTVSLWLYPHYWLENNIVPAIVQLIRWAALGVAHLGPGTRWRAGTASFTSSKHRYVLEEMHFNYAPARPAVSPSSNPSLILLRIERGLAKRAGVPYSNLKRSPWKPPKNITYLKCKHSIVVSIILSTVMFEYEIQ